MLIPPYAVFAAAVVALHLFVRYKSATWDEDAILIVSFVLPLVLAGCLTAGLGYYQLHTEWRTNAVYLLLSLPVRGWKVLTAKLAAVMSLFLLSLLWLGASFGLVLLGLRWEMLSVTAELSEMLPVMLNYAVNSTLLYGLVMLLVLSILQFAFLCGQLAARLRWLVVIAAFFGIVWLVFRISPVLSALLAWTPDVFFGGGIEAAYLYSGPLLVLLLISAGIVWLSGYLLEKEVEV